MTDKAIVRDGRAAVSTETTDLLAAATGVDVQHDLGDAAHRRRRPCRPRRAGGVGARVKLLPDTNLIRFYDQVVDIEVADVLAEIPSRRRVPRAERATWPHHVVQLDGPPVPSWVSEIEALGADVVEPIGAYGLFVIGSPDQLQAIDGLPFVAWTGPFEPAWRISPTLAAARGRVPVLVGVCPPDRVDDVRQAIEASGGTVESVRVAEPGQARAGTATRVATIRATIDAGPARDDIARCRGSASSSSTSRWTSRTSARPRSSPSRSRPAGASRPR